MSGRLLKMNKLFSLLAIVAIATMVCACSDNGNTEHKTSSGAQINHNIVKQGGQIVFTLGDREFRIPEANFKGGAETGGGELIRATLWGLLPDFEGYDKPKNHAEFFKHRNGKGWGNYVEIELYRRLERISIPVMVERRARPERLSAISGRVGRYDEMRYGLEYYRSKNSSDDIYLYREDGQLVMFIQCPSENVLKTRPYPRCTYYWDISMGTSYEMSYGIDYLPQWREIWGNAKRLLDVKR